MRHTAQWGRQTINRYQLTVWVVVRNRRSEVVAVWERSVLHGVPYWRTRLPKPVEPSLAVFTPASTLRHFFYEHLARRLAQSQRAPFPAAPRDRLTDEELIHHSFKPKGNA